jgi:hypothetical protein
MDEAIPMNRYFLSNLLNISTARPITQTTVAMLFRLIRSAMKKTMEYFERKAKPVRVPIGSHRETFFAITIRNNR